MKRIALIFSFLAVSLSMYAQSAAFDKFLSSLYVPLEFGVTVPSNSNIQAGLLFKTCAEWRLQAMKGPFCSIQYETSEHRYNGLLPEGSNLSEGDITFQDFYLGAGYRVTLAEGLCASASLQGGMTMCTHSNITPGLSGDYLSRHIDTRVPTIKPSISLEYFILDGMAIYIAASYAQHLKQLPISTSMGNNGNTLLSIGLTTSM